MHRGFLVRCLAEWHMESRLLADFTSQRSQDALGLSALRDASDLSEAVKWELRAANSETAAICRHRAGIAIVQPHPAYDFSALEEETSPGYPDLSSLALGQYASPIAARRSRPSSRAKATIRPRIRHVGRRHDSDEEDPRSLSACSASR